MSRATGWLQPGKLRERFQGVNLLGRGLELRLIWLQLDAVEGAKLLSPSEIAELKQEFREVAARYEEQLAEKARGGVQR